MENEKIFCSLKHKVWAHVQGLLFCLTLPGAASLTLPHWWISFSCPGIAAINNGQDKNNGSNAGQELLMISRNLVLGLFETLQKQETFAERGEDRHLYEQEEVVVGSIRAGQPVCWGSLR